MEAPIENALREIRHDLRNDLSSVRNAIFYIRRKVATSQVYRDDPRLPYFFEIIERSIAHASELVETGLEGTRPEGAAPMRATGRERFLLVEDDESNGLTLSALLEDEGFAVDLARSAAEARSCLLAATLPFDVILLDHDLGDGLGTDLVAMIRERSPATAIVLMSGSDSEALDLARPDARFIKGDPPEALLGAIDALLRGA